MKNGPKTSLETENAVLRLKLNAAEFALTEAEAHIADLHDQLTRANSAAVRMARRIKVRVRAEEIARVRA